MPSHFRWRPFIVPLVVLLAAEALVVWLFLRRQPPAPPIPRVDRSRVVVTTFAGSGAPGAAVGSALDCYFADPFGIAVDRAGTVFVSDGGDNNRIDRITADGRHSSVLAGEGEGFADGAGLAASFNSPSGLAVDRAGNVYVADTGNNAVRRIAPDGVVVTIAGGDGAGSEDGIGPNARFSGPIGIAVAADSGVLVADSYNDRIRKIAPDGRVTTIAGSATGYRDGPAALALFDTPSGLAIDANGDVLVADTGNDLIRRIDTRGEVTTVGGVMPIENETARRASLSHPASVAVGDDGAVYVSDTLGRVLRFERDGRAHVIAGTLPGFANGSGVAARFNNPVGLAVLPGGSVLVADSDNYVVRRLTPVGESRPASDVSLDPVPRLTPATLNLPELAWPLDPQRAWHEIAATLGEARGSIGGDGRDRLHSGIDVRGDVGAIVRSVRNEKVRRPIPTSGFDDLNEAIRVDQASYVHVRVGRRRTAEPLDPERFAVARGPDGIALRVRVRRGTRFAVGDPIGTVNRFAHVHLTLGPVGNQLNALEFGLPGFKDHVAPVIVAKGVELCDDNGNRLTAARRRPITVSGRVDIIVEAFDRVDGNSGRRRLGVYSLGYQVRRRDGTPVAGFEQPRMTIAFNWLAADPDASRLAYAEGSGITVYGNRVTRFRYIVTNTVRDGTASRGYWDTSALAPGDYVLRVFAEDLSGNVTTRDIDVDVQAK